MDVNILFKWLWFGKEMLNVFTTSNADESPSWLELFVEGLESMGEFGDYVSILNSTITLNEVGMRLTTGGEIVTHWFPLGLPGVVGGEPCPPIVAPVISFQYAGTRPNRGRCYQPGLSEASCDDGLVDSAFRTAVQTFFESWALSGVPVSGFGDTFLRIGRRNEMGSIISSNPVTSVICRQNPGRMGSRRPSNI